MYKEDVQRVIIIVINIGCDPFFVHFGMRLYSHRMFWIFRLRSWLMHFGMNNFRCFRFIVCNCTVSLTSFPYRRRPNFRQFFDEILANWPNQVLRIVSVVSMILDWFHLMQRDPVEFNSIFCSFLRRIDPLIWCIISDSDINRNGGCRAERYQYHQQQIFDSAS